MSKVVYEGWMVRYGRRKIGGSFIHMRYFVLESRLLAYYKRKPQDNVVPIKTLLIDGNYRVEDRGSKTHHGHMVYVLSVNNKREKYKCTTELLWQHLTSRRHLRGKRKLNLSLISIRVH